jgi:TRAP-type uncharacterized transport system fused permease subunit
MIIPNIIAYTLMAYGSFRAFNWSQKYGNKFTLIINYLLMCWCAFMAIYLIAEYKAITTHPINIMLNAFETTTNIILALYLLSFNLKNR